MEDVALPVFEEYARRSFIFPIACYVGVVDECLPLGNVLGSEGRVVVVVESVARRGDPLEAPSHALLVGVDLVKRGSRNDNKRNVALGDVNVHPVEVIRGCGAVSAARVGLGREHEVIDDKLGLGAKEIGECFFAGRSVKDVVF